MKNGKGANQGQICAQGPLRQRGAGAALLSRTAPQSVALHAWRDTTCMEAWLEGRGRAEPRESCRDKNLIDGRR